MTVKEAQNAVKNGETKAALDACLEALENTECPIPQWAPILEQALKNSKEGTEEAGWAALDAIELRLSPSEAIPQARHVLRFFSKNDEFRQRGLSLYRKAYEDTAGLDELLDISGLAGGKPIRRAMQTLDICLQIQPGSFLVHRDDGPPAKVASVDASNWSVRLETPSGEELVDPLSLGDQYEIAESHDFRVLSRFDPESFSTTLEKDPGDIVVTIVRAHGNEMTSDELEGMLSPRHIAPGSWGKWWTKVRAVLRKNPQVRLEGRNPVTIYYENHAISIEDEIWTKFNPHASPKAWLDLATEYARECRDKNLQFSNDFLRRLRDAAHVEAQALLQRKEDPALAAWLVDIELTRQLEETADLTPAMETISSNEDLATALTKLPNETFVGLALDVVQQCRPEDWPEEFSKVLPYLHPGRCDAVAAAVKKAGKAELLQSIPEQILAEPVMYASGLCWLFQGPKDDTLFKHTPLITALTRLLSAIEHWRKLPVEIGKEVRARARAVLIARKFARFDECMSEIDAGMANAVRTQIQRSTALSDAVRTDLIARIRRAFPEMWAQPRKKRWEDDSVLYCTSYGKRAKEAELQELVNVKMKENAKAIGEAASHGDLSENSEYKFALEERDLLQARVAEIQSQLSKAEVIENASILVDHVGIGTKVTFEHVAGGQSMTLTFLGPWEARVEEHILNYLAPLSQSIMGHTIGDTIEIEFSGDQGEYRIAAIEPADV